MTENTDMVLLNQKLDMILEQMEAQRQKQAVLEELLADMGPIANHLVKLTIDELDEIGNDFQLEDLLFLGKRLLRDTRMLNNMIDRLESTVELVDEVGLLVHPMFNNMVEHLDNLERAGYFSFAQNGWYIVERIVTEFDEEDVRALGDNVVTILKTVRNMTQPEVLSLANNLIDNMRVEEPAENVSVLHLLREMNDPQVRKGLAKMLGVVKSLADQPKTTTN